MEKENKDAKDATADKNEGSPTVGKKAIVGLSGHFGHLTLGRQPDINDEASGFTSVQDFGGMVQTPHNFDPLEEAAAKKDPKTPK